MKLTRSRSGALGATGADNGTIVYNGAALDIAGAFTTSSSEKFTIEGHGPDGRGALISTVAGANNYGVSGELFLAGDATIGAYARMDLVAAAKVRGNGHTLTKSGNAELAVRAAVENCKIVIDGGAYTYMSKSALGDVDYDTTLNAGLLQAYGDFTCNDPLVCNGGGITASGSGANKFTIAGPTTLNGMVNVRANTATQTLDLAGALTGTGGFKRVKGGRVIITGNANTYSGPTIIDSDAEPLYVGEMDDTSGWFGCGAITNGTMTGVVNQVSGVVRTTGENADNAGLRLGHWPQAYSFYNMMGGTLVVDNDYDLSCATDGQGWFIQTGGEVFAKRLMMNKRTGSTSYGSYVLAGGTLNLGALTGASLANANGIVHDNPSPYKLELGGAGGTLRAVTNILVAVDAELVASGAEAVNFDSAGWEITVSGKLSGAGGFNKVGQGDLKLGGVNSYAGLARIMEGRLVLAVPEALPAGAAVLCGVRADDGGGRLHSDGLLYLDGLELGVANPDALDPRKHYTVATWGLGLVGEPDAGSLPSPWHFHENVALKRLELRADVGTVIMLQ